MPKQPPQAALNDLPREYVSETVNSLAELHSKGRVQTDQECKERIQQYFEFCGKSGLRPGVEGLCLSLGITRQTLSRWMRCEDCTQERQILMQSAKQYIAAFLEQILVSGKGSTVGAIFACKNWLGYRDSIILEEAPPKQTLARMTPEEISRQIEQDIPIDLDEAEIKSIV